MRFWCFVGIIFLLIVEESEGATQASCRTTTSSWSLLDQTQKLKTCEIDMAIVDDEDFTISSSRDPSTLGLSMLDKKSVEFLPRNLFSVFPDLVVLQAWNCSVIAVSKKHFGGLSKLRTLNLAHNKIEHVASDAFVDLVSLEKLGLNNNRIQFLGKNTFASLKALKELFLNENEIQFLHPKIFSSLVNLEHIDLGNNEILSLDEKIFETLTSLQNISLAANKLEAIPKGLFKNNLKLEHIWLQDSKINSIDGNMFDHLSSLDFVNLKGNLCSGKSYWASSFGAMKNDLKENCAENSIQETLANAKKGLQENTKSLSALDSVQRNLELKFQNSERQKADVQRQLHSKAREIEVLKKEIEAMKRENLQTNQKLELLEKNMAANYKVLNQRVDAVNETAQGVEVTFEG